MRSQLARFTSKAMTSKPLITPTRPIHWILDWDGTLTRRDTLDALVNIATEAKPDANVRWVWEDIKDAYLSDYYAARKALVPEGKLPTTVEDERKLLKDLEVVEGKSLKRVSASGIFNGFTAATIESGAAKAMRNEQVQLRAGVEDFFQLVQNRMKDHADGADAVDILSVNWSQRFIAGCLKATVRDLRTATPNRAMFEQKRDSKDGLTQSTHSQESSTDRDTDRTGSDSSHVCVNIYSNELQGVGRGEGSTGVLCAEGDNKIISSSDKLAYFQGLQKIGSIARTPIPIVYVGDSWTDLECLVAAELGICIRDDPMTSSQRQLKDALERLGITCLHLHDVKSMDQRNVVWARDFVEIRTWLQELGR
jgi:2-hydroxy-3-keto-5-methylthiopentenyl-1-phosphate phosphatase